MPVITESITRKAERLNGLKFYLSLIVYFVTNPFFMRVKLILLHSALFFFVNFARAQVGFGNENIPVSCGASAVMKDLLQKDPAINSFDQQIEQQLAQYRKSGLRPLNPQTVVTLPVVVHIIHNNGPENISDTRVLAGIQHLNEAYANTGYYNPADGVNTNIQFCIAQRDPNGNPANGITRNVSTYTNMGGPNYYSDDQNIKNINRWNPSCYINIWLVNDIPGAVAGYAYLPSAAGTNVDGIILEAAYFGSSNSSDVVVIHEVGHYLGLYHTFEQGCNNADCITDGDKVCDTPPDNSTAYTSCSVHVNSCSTDTQSGFSTDQSDLTEDYMDYGNWGCMTVFTQGQADRMNWFITNVRSSLLNCRSCLPPCPNPVTAGFNSSAINVTVGTFVNFANTSINGVTYQWYINNILQSGAFNFSNTFNTAGQYAVKLVVTGNNTSLCDSSVVTQVINVSCPVNAGFTASAIEVSIGQSINFTNTSMGSPASYAWYIDNVLLATTVNFSNLFNLPGTFTIKLVIGTGLCTSEKTITIDVATPCDNNRYFEKMITLPTMHFGPKHTVIASDSGIIMVGTTNSQSPYTTTLTVMKLSKNGNFLWAKNYYNNYITPERIMQLSDGNFLVGGFINFSTGNGGPFLMKIDGNGQIIWQKSYDKTVIINAYSIVKLDMIETSSNDIILGISLERSNSDPTNTYLMRLNNTGTITWSKEVTGISSFRNFVLNSNSLYVNFLSSSTTPLQYSDHIAKVDISNASLSFAKKYYLPPPTVVNSYPLLKFQHLAYVNDQISLYGNIVEGGGIGDTGSHIIAKIDTFGVIQNLKRIRFTDPLLYITANLPDYFRNGIALKNGEYSFFEFGQSPLFPWASKVFLGHADQSGNSTSTNQIMKGLICNFHFTPLGYSLNYNIAERDGNNVIVTSIARDSAQSLTALGTVVYSSDYSGVVSTNCPITQSAYTYFPNIIQTINSTVTLIDAPFIPGVTNVILDSAIQFNSYNICGASNTASCYSVKIDSPDTLCVAQDSVLISCHRNPGCTETINWSISAPAQNAFSQINDTTIKVNFTTYGNYTIVAALGSCSSINDTAHMFISRNAALVSLGSDVLLCTASTIKLNAGTGYKSYQWHDGSTDSTNTVYHPGSYFVTVTDYCNNVAGDTIIVSVAAAVPFELGSDTTRCTGNTLSITAPPGFSNYTWAPNYNINATNGQMVNVSPDVDTIYTVTALVNNGCRVLDSIKVRVQQSVPIRLGNDTSFCQGGSINLSVGNGFSNFHWNTGSVAQFITVSSAGMYTVFATDINGCISKDTFKIITIYPNPSIDLGDDTYLCINKTLLLDAGSGYTNYLWQDNSVAQTFTANSIGLYWVHVINSNGCTGADSLSILNVIDSPKFFIAASINICTDKPNTIKVNGSYNSYLWSNGSTIDSLVIMQPGNYWLQVSNSYGCIGKEGFVAIEKDCIRAVYLPNAFTPNDDNTNETFRPKVYGDLEYFKIEIYNRYGQKLYETADWTKGWNGTFKGSKQHMGTYVWICTYKLKNVAEEIQKGTVLLLR